MTEPARPVLEVDAVQADAIYQAQFTVETQKGAAVLTRTVRSGSGAPALFPTRAAARAAADAALCETLHEGRPAPSRKIKTFLVHRVSKGIIAKVRQV